MERRVRQRVMSIFCAKEELKGALEVSTPTEPLNYWCIAQVRQQKNSIFLVIGTFVFPKLVYTIIVHYMRYSSRDRVM